MQVQMWEWLNAQADQNWVNADQATKFVAEMLKIQSRENLRKEAYHDTK